MEKDSTNRNSNRKSVFNIKILVVTVVILMAVIVATVILISNSDNAESVLGDGLFGEYAADSGDLYIRFQGENKVTYEYTITGNRKEAVTNLRFNHYYTGTYTLEGNEIVMELTLYNVGEASEAPQITVEGNISEDRQTLTLKDGNILTKTAMAGVPL